MQNNASPNVAGHQYEIITHLKTDRAVLDCFCDLRVALEKFAATSSTQSAATLHLISGQVQLAEQFFDQVSAPGSDRNPPPVAEVTSDEEVPTVGDLNRLLNNLKNETVKTVNEAVAAHASEQVARCFQEFRYTQNNEFRHPEARYGYERYERLPRTKDATTQTLGAKLYKRDFLSTEQLEQQKLINSNAQLVKEVKALRNLHQKK